MRNILRYAPLFLSVSGVAFAVLTLLFQSVTLGILATLFFVLCAYAKTITLPSVHSEMRVKNPNLKPCPDCEEAVSKRAFGCPHCGAPLGTKKSILPKRMILFIIDLKYVPIFLLVLIIAFVALALLYKSAVFGVSAALFLIVHAYIKDAMLPYEHSKIQSEIEVKNPYLKPCPDCGEAVSKRALKCPHCEAPLNVLTARMYLSIILILCLYGLANILKIL